MSEKITTEQVEFALVSMDKAIEHAYEYRRKNPSWDEEEADFDLKSDNAALATIRARLLRCDELEKDRATVPYDILLSCLSRLEAAGYGRPQENGYSKHGNTLLGMITEVIECAEKAEAKLEKLGRVVDAGKLLFNCREHPSIGDTDYALEQLKSAILALEK